MIKNLCFSRAQIVQLSSRIVNIQLPGSLEDYGELIYQDFVSLRLGKVAKFKTCYIICFQTIILVCQPLAPNSGWSPFKEPIKTNSLKLWFLKYFPVNLLISQASLTDKVLLRLSLSEASSGWFKKQGFVQHI